MRERERSLVGSQGRRKGLRSISHIVDFCYLCVTLLLLFLQPDKTVTVIPVTAVPVTAAPAGGSVTGRHVSYPCHIILQGLGSSVLNLLACKTQQMIMGQALN